MRVLATKGGFSSLTLAIKLIILCKRSKMFLLCLYHCVSGHLGFLKNHRGHFILFNDIKCATLWQLAYLLTRRNCKDNFPFCPTPSSNSMMKSNWISISGSYFTPSHYFFSFSFIPAHPLKTRLTEIKAFGDSTKSYFENNSKAVYLTFNRVGSSIKKVEEWF